MSDEKSRLLSFCLLRKGVNDENISRDWGDISGGAGKSRIYAEGLAEKIGVTAVSISRWENGNNMKIDMFQKIVSALGVSADSILGTEKKDDSIPEMMAALPVKERQIVYQTVTAMISAMLEN